LVHTKRRSGREKKGFVIAMMGSAEGGEKIFVKQGWKKLTKEPRYHEGEQNSKIEGSPSRRGCAVRTKRNKIPKGS